MRQRNKLSYLYYETNSQRKTRINQKRLIRKQKLIGKNKEIRTLQTKSQLKIIPLASEKLIQKIKNRQAAQKSREEKKGRQQELMMENQSLRKRIIQLEEARHYCSQCHQILIETSKDSDRASEKNFEFGLQRTNSSESFLSVGRYIMIFMIILGAAMLIPSSNIPDTKRNSVIFSSISSRQNDENWVNRGQEKKMQNLEMTGKSNRLHSDIKFKSQNKLRKSASQEINPQETDAIKNDKNNQQTKENLHPSVEKQIQQQKMSSIYGLSFHHKAQ